MGERVGKTKLGKGTQLMVVVDNASLPLAIYAESAVPHEVRLVEQTLQTSFVSRPPDRLIGDKAYHSDPLDRELKKQGIEMIAPHKQNRKKPKTQDGRRLCCYKRHWKVERFLVWLQNLCRVATRFDYKAENYLGFVHLGCIVILLRAYL